MAKVATKDITGRVLTIKFANNSTLICNIDLLSDEMRERLMMHGLSQKIGDSYASAESVEQACDNATTQWDGLLNGDWATRATGGILAEALAQVSGKPVEECRAALRLLDDKKKRALQKDARILAAIAAIQAERAKDAKPVDLADLF